MRGEYINIVLSVKAAKSKLNIPWLLSSHYVNDGCDAQYYPMGK